MLRTALIALALLLSAAAAARADAPPAQIPAGEYVLDPRRASLVVRVPLFGGLSRYALRFGRLSGAFAYDPADPAAANVSITADPRSIEAGDAQFSRLVISQFEPERYPAIRFTATGVMVKPGGRGRLPGQLYLHGVTRPLTLDLKLEAVRGDRVRFSGSGRVRRSQFGMSASRPFAGDVVDLLFDVEFARR